MIRKYYIGIEFKKNYNMKRITTKKNRHKKLKYT